MKTVTRTAQFLATVFMIACGVLFASNVVAQENENKAGEKYDSNSHLVIEVETGTPSWVLEDDYLGSWYQPAQTIQVYNPAGELLFESTRNSGMQELSQEAQRWVNNSALLMESSEVKIYMQF